jgi:two-component system phosphate regulon response regulator OmpR
MRQVAKHDPLATMGHPRDDGPMMTAGRILVIDDEPDLRLLLERYLGEQGFAVTVESDGRRVAELLQQEGFDLLVLDLMMPGENGLSICRRLRASGETLPILMLTAKGDPIDRIIGLESGADDYLAKPFTPRELVARIQAQLRRREMDLQQTNTSIERAVFGPFVLDLKTRTLNKAGKLIVLSSVEYLVLRALVKHPNIELSRDKLLDLSKGPDTIATDRSIDVQILRLRRIIEEDPAAPKRIQTVRGVGYVFVPDAPG